jgi:hypothetical protein
MEHYGIESEKLFELLFDAPSILKISLKRKITNLCEGRMFVLSSSLLRAIPLI